MKRVVAGLIGLIATAAVLVGCSDDKGSEPAPAPTTAAAGGAEVSTGGGATEIKVEGADLAGVDPASVTCVKQWRQDQHRQRCGGSSAGPWCGDDR